MGFQKCLGIERKVDIVDTVDLVDIIEIVHALVMVHSQKRGMDSVVIYQEFCGYLPRILWLLLSNMGLAHLKSSILVAAVVPILNVSRSSILMLLASYAGNTHLVHRCWYVM